LFPYQLKRKIRIRVEVDRTWITSEWVAHRSLEWTQMGTKHRRLEKPKQKPFIEYGLSLPPFAVVRPTSQAILND
jgi:hypothetical protein